MTTESLGWALVGSPPTVADLSALREGLLQSASAVSIPIYCLLVFILILSIALLWNCRIRNAALSAVVDFVVQKEKPLSKEDLFEICERLPSGLFREQMEEYIEALVPLAGQFYNTQQTDSFLKDEAVLQDIALSNRIWRGVRFPLLKVIPGIFTGLGILGTFLGIALGLGILGEASRRQSEAEKKAKATMQSEAKRRSAPGTTATKAGGAAPAKAKDKLADHVPAVIRKLSLAFWTSIIAVVFAILIGFLGNTAEARLLRTVNAFREGIDRRVVRLTPDKLLEQVSDRLKESKFLLDGINEYACERNVLLKQGTSVLEQVELQSKKTTDELALVRGNSSAIENLLSGQALVEWKSQTQLLKQIQEDTAENRKLTQGLANDMAEKLGEQFGTAISTHLGPHLETMAESVRVQMEAATESSSDHARRFADEAVKQMTGALQSSIQHMGTEVKSASDQIGSASAHMHDVVNSAAESMAQQHEAMALSDRTVAAAQDQSREAAKSVVAMQSVVGELAGMIKELQSGQARAAKLQDAQRDLQQQSADGVANLVSSAQSVTDAYAQAANHLLEALTKLEAHFDVIDEAVEELTTETKTAVEGIREASDRIFTRVKVEQELVEQYGNTARKFSDAFREGAPLIERLALVSEAAKQALGHLKDGQHELSAMQVEQRDIQAQSAMQVSGVVDGIGVATEAYAKTAANLGQIIESLEGMLGGLGGSIGKLSSETTVAGSTIREAADRIGDRVADEERLLEGYGEATRSFEKAFTSSQSTMDRVSKMALVVTEAMKKADSERQGVDALRKQLVDAGTILQEAAQGFSLDVTSSQESFQHASKTISSTVDRSSARFTEVLDGSEEWALAVNAELAKFSSRLDDALYESLNKFDEILGTAVRSLASTIEDLDDVADRLRRQVASLKE